MIHDYKRNGTTTLFATLNVLHGQVIGQCQQRHTHIEWLKLLKKIDRETPKDKALHLIADNYTTHKHPCFKLVQHPFCKFFGCLFCAAVLAGAMRARSAR